MRQCIMPLVSLFIPVAASAHSGVHAGTQGLDALMHQLVLHGSGLMTCVAVVALGYGLSRRIIRSRKLALATASQSQREGQ